jgi:molybdate transport system ATP-binding protein
MCKAGVTSVLAGRSPEIEKPLSTTFAAQVIRHDHAYGQSTLFFGSGELRTPLVDAPVGASVLVTIDARDVAIALSRPMDVSITNRLPGSIVAVEPLALPYVQVTFDLGSVALFALVMRESVERLALEPGLRAWAMIKAVAIGPEAVRRAAPLTPRCWPGVDNPG